MSHEDEYRTLPVVEGRRQTRRPLDWVDEVDLVSADRKYGEKMALAASYIQKAGARRASGSSSPPTSTGASLHDESSTLKTSRPTTPDVSDLRSGSRPQRLTTSNRGGFSRSRLPSRPRNGRCLADVANKNTISKDNTNGDEVRTAELLANMGKKTYSILQQAKKLQAGGGEWRNKGRTMTRGPNPPLPEPPTEMVPMPPGVHEPTPPTDYDIVRVYLSPDSEEEQHVD